MINFVSRLHTLYKRYLLLPLQFVAYRARVNRTLEIDSTQPQRAACRLALDWPKMLSSNLPPTVSALRLSLPSARQPGCWVFMVLDPSGPSSIFSSQGKRVASRAPLTQVHRFPSMRRPSHLSLAISPQSNSPALRAFAPSMTPSATGCFLQTRQHAASLSLICLLSFSEIGRVDRGRLGVQTIQLCPQSAACCLTCSALPSTPRSLNIGWVLRRAIALFLQFHRTPLFQTGILSARRWTHQFETRRRPLFFV